MANFSRIRSFSCTFLIVLTALSSLASISAQTLIAPMPRIAAPVDDSQRTTLAGNTPLFARPEFDRGPAPDDVQGRMLLVLKRSADQEAALQQLLQSQQTPGSNEFHKWLKPADFGNRFGIADADLQTITAYLSSQGFQVGRVYGNKAAIEVTGTASQIRDTFHTEIHQYQIGERQFFANQGDPQIPAALAPVVAGFASLNNFRAMREPQLKTAAYDRTTGTVHPLYDGTAMNGNPNYAVSPEDLAKIYDLPAPSGATPAAIGIVSDSNVNLAFVENYDSLFKTGAAVPTVVVDGNDPGISTDSLTTLEQLEIISGVDPKASITLYTSATTDYDTGIDFAIIRAVDDDVVNVLNIGVSQCEANLGASGNAFLNAVWEQAAAEGISVIAAAGDSGSAACDIPGASSGTEVSVNGLAVNGYASTPFATAIGGTDFDYGTSGTSKTTVAASWSATNTGTPAFTSALGYIAEQPWNDSLQTYDQIVSTPAILAGGGGGPSTLGLNGTAPYPLPAWQTVAAGISATARVVPDLAFFAGNGQNYSSYLLCAQASDCAVASPTFTLSGGTAAAAAVFSGIAGLLVQKDGAQGNLNPELYALYSASKTAFHDVAQGSNSVACSAGTGCTAGYLTGYKAGAGYDAASGLGSVDTTKFINSWGSVNGEANKPTLTLAIQKSDGTAVPPSGITHGTPVLLTVTASGSAGTPTGDVSIQTSNAFAAEKGIETLTLSGGTANDSSNYDDFLPGGTYNLVASYPGSLTYAPATSNSIPITVSPEASQVLLVSGSLAGFNNGVFTGATIQYGTGVTITVEPFSLNPNGVGIPSGSVQVYDQQTQAQLASLPLNSEGSATMSLNQLPVGSHSLWFSYGGDASYKASTSLQNSNGGSIQSTLPGSPIQGAVSFVVTTDTAVTTLSTSTSTVSLENTSATLTAVVEAATLPNTGRGPSGSVKFSDGNTVALTLSYDSSGNVIGTASEVVTPNLILGGSATYSAQYVPDANSTYSAGATSNTVTISENVLTLPSTDTTTTITASTGGTSFANTSSLVFDIKVVGKILGIIGSIPNVSGTVTILANGVQVGNPVTLNAGSATFTVPTTNNYLDLPNGPVTITAQYNGDGTINGCFLLCPAAAQKSYGEDQITITGNTGGGGSTNPALSGDFSIASLTTAQFVSPSAQTATYGLQLTSLDNYAANYGSTTPVNLTCSAPAGLSCSFSSTTVVTTSSANLSSGSAQLNLYVTSASGYTLASLADRKPRPWWPVTGGITLACMFLGAVPRNRRRFQALVMLVLLCFAGAGLQGCSGNAGVSAAETGIVRPGGGSGLGAQGSSTVSTGTYSILVTASAVTTTTVIHSVTVNLVVQ